MSFYVLSKLGVKSQDGEICPAGLKVQSLLVMLILAKGRLVSVEKLIDVIWEDNEGSADIDLTGSLYSQIRHLKDYLRNTDALIPAREGGYRLLVPEKDVDLYRFCALADTLLTLVRRGDPHDDTEIARLGRAALDEWGGGLRGCEPLHGLPGKRMAAYRQDLLKRRREVLIPYLEAELRLGNGDRLVAELADLEWVRPFDERILRCLMQAHYQAGDRFKAIEVYERLRRRAEIEYSTKISRETVRLLDRIVNEDPTLHPTIDGAAMSPPPEITAIAQSATDVLAPALPFLTGSDVPEPIDRIQGVSWAKAKAIWITLQKTEVAGCIPEPGQEAPSPDVLRDRLADVLARNDALVREIESILAGKDASESPAQIKVSGDYFHRGDNIYGTSIKHYNG